LGDFDCGLHYETSLTNGLATSRRATSALDDNMAWAGTMYWDPWGEYGNGSQDFGYHGDPVLRIGCGALASRTEDRADSGFPLGDDSFLRLTDGTPLSAVGALAPGVRVTSAQTYQTSIDAGLKYRGWSLNTEYHFRWIQDLGADGAIPVTQLAQRGFHVQAGTFLIPRTLGLDFEVTHVAGLYGDGYTYGVGLNYYWSDDRVNKFTFDVLDVQRSPDRSPQAGLFAGDDGQLVRAQVQIGF
jgi:hypothetical protein